MVYTLLFSSSKCSLFHNSNVFGSYIIHILYTRCVKIKKKIIRRQNVELSTSTLKLEAEICFEALITTDKTIRCQYRLI